MMTVHVFTDGCDYYIAETIDQAREMQRHLIGENPGEIEYWNQCEEDDELRIWLDNPGDVSEHGVGELVLGTYRIWAESFEPGFLCSTEY